MASLEFQTQLTKSLPRLRAAAYRLTNNWGAAEDLVQDVAIKALTANASFMPGTNLIAWTRRIMHSHFISGLRAKRESSLADVPERTIAPSQQDSAEVREATALFHRLPVDRDCSDEKLKEWHKEKTRHSQAAWLVISTGNRACDRKRAVLQFGQPPDFCPGAALVSLAMPQAAIGGLAPDRLRYDDWRLASIERRNRSCSRQIHSDVG